jgi:hypothetical protein
MNYSSFPRLWRIGQFKRTSKKEWCNKYSQSHDYDISLNFFYEVSYFANYNALNFIKSSYEVF